MNNSDMPAMPQSVSNSVDGGSICSSDFMGCEGISKREYFAGLEMQGLLSNPAAMEMTSMDTAMVAVDHADFLLKELGETK